MGQWFGQAQTLTSRLMGISHGHTTQRVTLEQEDFPVRSPFSPFPGELTPHLSVTWR